MAFAPLGLMIILNKENLQLSLMIVPDPEDFRSRLIVVLHVILLCVPNRMVVMADD